VAYPTPSHPHYNLLDELIINLHFILNLGIREPEKKRIGNNLIILQNDYIYRCLYNILYFLCLYNEFFIILYNILKIAELYC